MSTPISIRPEDEILPNDLHPDWLASFEHRAASISDDRLIVRHALDCLIHAVELLKLQASFPEASKVLEQLIRQAPANAECQDRLVIQAHIALASANGELDLSTAATSLSSARVLPEPPYQTDPRVRHLVEKRVHALFQHSLDVVGVINQSGTIEYVSDSIENMLGYRAELATGELPINVEWAAPEPVREAFHRIALTPYGTSTTVVAQLPHADGSFRWIETTLTNRLGDTTVNGVVFNSRDVTEIKSNQEQLEHLAYVDTLTSLPNRNQFRINLDQALEQASKDGRIVAVIFIDLDRFKLINDQFGHDEGDIFLGTVGQRLVETLHPGEAAARLGGDEFAVLIEDTTATRALDRAQGVLRALDLPFPGNQRFFNIRASAGVAVSENGLSTTTELLRAADIALYNGKRLGGGVATLFEPGMYELVFQRASMERDLRQALEHHELHPWLQPEFDLDTGQPVSLELLMRWHRPDGSIADPELFLQTANETGLVVPVSLEVIEHASAALVALNATRHEFPLRMSINVSQRQMAVFDFADRIQEVLTRTGCPAEWFSIEIDDRLLMTADPDVDRLVTAVRSLGMGLVVDGFSGGSASLIQLHRLRPDRLKYRRYTDMLDISEELDFAMLSAVTAVAREIDAPVTIVGKTDLARLGRAHLAGCRFAQTSLLCPPTPLSNFAVVLGQTIRQARLIAGMRHG